VFFYMNSASEERKDVRRILYLVDIHGRAIDLYVTQVTLVEF